jgi:hypothetical protein
LMPGVAGNQKREHIPHPGVVSHMIQAGQLQATLRLGGDI